MGRKSGKLGSVKATGGSKRKSRGGGSGGAQGLAMENARAMGSSSAEEVTFFPGVKVNSGGKGGKG